MGSGTSSLREMKPDPMPWPRTSRDAGPYLARMVFASGWGLAVGGWVDGRVEGGVDGRVEGRVDEWVEGRVEGWVDE